MPRDYQDYKHTAGLAESDAGKVWMQPTKATHIYFDAAKANHIPAMKPTGEHGSTVLDVGRGVRVRVSGHAHLVDGAWSVDAGCFYASRDNGGDVTTTQKLRAMGVVEEMVQRWADDHPGELADAERCDRRACDGGRAWKQYPDLPTTR